MIERLRGGRNERGSSAPWADVDATAVNRRTAEEATPIPEPAGPAASALPPRSLGRYLLIDEIGRGAMGIVYRAYDPKLQREVALKRVVTGRLDASAQARLVREARAMARINDPHVVAVHDVELSDEKRAGVVIVMEYVPGQTLREWLLEGQTPDAIVAAFVAAGRGLAAAHAEGLLHRDFKPDNVLIGKDGRVRVTDFGLVRSTSPTGPASEEGDATGEVLASLPGGDGAATELELTAEGTVMGTPAYMPPEQMAGCELDASSDQYAFCVALWRALTGRWPFDGYGASLLAAKREGGPAWPSALTPPARHIVDAIRRGLAPFPVDRWPDLPALLSELERNPQRRRRQALGLVAGVALAATGGLAWGPLQRARATAACATESTAIAEVWNDARGDAVAGAFAATGIDYAADTWLRSRERVDAYAAQWSATRRSVCERAEVADELDDALAEAARACLDEGRDGLDALLHQLVAADATGVQWAGTATASLPPLSACIDPAWLRVRGNRRPAEAVRARVRELEDRLLEVGALRSTGHYAVALERAEGLLTEATDLQWAPLIVRTRLELATAHERLGQYEAAHDAAETAYLEAGAAGHDELALQAATTLTFVTGDRLARRDEGLRWGRQAQMLVDRMGLPEGVATAALRVSVAAVHDGAGEYEEAVALHEQALAIRRALLGPEHPFVGQSLNNLGQTRFTMGQYEEAKTLFVRAEAVFEGAFGPRHPLLATTLLNLANVHFYTGATKDALATHRRALEILEGALGPDHPHVASSLTNFAAVVRASGDAEQARTLHERALSIRIRVLGPDHPDTGTSLFNLATVDLAEGDLDEARIGFEEALAVWEKQGRDYTRLPHVLLALTEIALRQERPVDALPLARRALRLREEGESTPVDIAAARFAVARALWGAGGSKAEARALAEAAHETYRDEGVAPAKLAPVEGWLAKHAAPA